MSKAPRIVAVVAGFGLVGLGIAATVAQEAGESPPAETFAEPAPSRYADAEGRLQAALADREAEEARIAKAQSSFNAALTTSPDQVRDYLISLAEPVVAPTLLAGLPDIKDLEMKGVFTWLQASPSSIHIGNGEHSADAMGWSKTSDGVQNAQQFLAKLYDEYLVNRQAALLKSSSKAPDAESQQALAQQASETQQVQAASKANGVPIFALRCFCSPSAIKELENAVSGLKLRAVEDASEFSAPIAVYDPVRDLIISSGGRYGR